jgi:multiple sugar transport system substrate-binding protein
VGNPFNKGESTVIMKSEFVTRRRFIGAASVGAVGAMGLLLAACGGAAAPAAAPTTAAAAPTAAGNAPAPTTPPAAAAPTTAPAAKAGQQVNWLVRTTPQENDGQAKVFEPALKAKYPDLKINRIIVPQTEYIPKINTMGAAKESLEIWGFGGNYLDYWARGLSEPLDQYITADKWDINSYFLPGLPDIYKIHGKYYGLNQLTCYGSNLVYNKKLFDEAGLTPPPADWNDTSWTMDKAIEYGLKLTKNYGKPDGVYGISWSLWDRMTSVSYLYGEDSWLPEHYTNYIAPKTNFATPGNIAGHQLRHDMIYKHKIHPDPALDQGLNQFANPFKTGKIAMVMDGGWQFWTTSDVNDFKFGFAAVPSVKANKTINFDDFWIMGSWSTNKENAWKVMRVLTDVQPVTDYSLLSGTPPTVRASTDPWIKKISDHTGQSVDDLKKVTAGAIETKRSQESPDHLFVQHPKIDDTYTQEANPLWTDQAMTAEKFWPGLTKKMDDVVAAIYDQFKDKMPKN